MNKTCCTTERVKSPTPRELDVLRQLATGMSNAEIAVALVLSVKTVEHHLANIYSKIGVTSRNQAILWAIENGIVVVTRR